MWYIGRMSQEVQTGDVVKAKIPRFPHRPYLLMPFLNLTIRNPISGEVMCAFQRHNSLSLEFGNTVPERCQSAGDRH